MKRGKRLGVVLALGLAGAVPVLAQDFQIANPVTAAWAGRVRDRLAQRDSLEAVYQRQNDRLRYDQNALAQLQYARPNAGENAYAFQQRIAFTAQQLRNDMAQTQQLQARTQQRLQPLYTALGKDYDYARSYPDPNVSQGIGTLIATAGHGLDPIWIHTPPVVVSTAAAGIAATDAAATVAANDAAAVAASTSAAAGTATQSTATGAARSTPSASTASSGSAASSASADAGRDQAISNAITLSGSARNVPAPSATDGAATATAADSTVAATTNAAATTANNAASSAARPQTIWTMEADQATGVMQMHARDAATMERLADVAPLPTKIQTSADASLVGGTTMKSMRSTAWVAEQGADGNTVFRAVNWKSHTPIADRATVTGEGTTELASAPAASAPTARTSGSSSTTVRATPQAASTDGAATAATETASTAAAAARTPAEMTNAVWTAEPNPSTGTMVLRARDAVTNNHLAGYKPVETDMPIPAGGHSDGVTATRSTFKNVTYTATHDAETNTLTFTPKGRNGAELPAGVKTVTAQAPESSPAAASETASGEATAAEGEAAAAGKPHWQMPSAKAVAVSAAKWGALSVGITAASNVATQLIQNGGHVDWNQAMSFMTDKHFWGGTVGGFAGSMAGGALAAFVPGGAFVKAALSIGGAALGYQVGSGQLGKTDWVGLGVTTVGAAAGTALGAALGPWGAIAGGIAGQMLSQFLYDKFREIRQGGPVAQPPVVAKGPPSLPGGQVPGPFIPGQIPVGQMPVSQMPSQMPVTQVGQYAGQVPAPIPGQIPVGQYQPGAYTSNGLPPVPPASILAGPPGAENYSSVNDLSQQMARVYQEKLLADQSGNSQLSYQKLIQYQQLNQRLTAMRQAAYQNVRAYNQ